MAHYLESLTSCKVCGQGRLLDPFMYKVYINGVLTELTFHSCALSLNNLSLP